jgi:hypothetical protein
MDRVDKGKKLEFRFSVVALGGTRRAVPMLLRHDSQHEQPPLAITPCIEPGGGPYGYVAAMKYTGNCLE